MATITDMSYPDLQTGGGTSLYNMYNPTESDLQDFGDWLWSTNVLDQLAKWFSNPIESIISLSKSYLPISATSDKKQIKFGAPGSTIEPSGLEMKEITNEYNLSTVGTISIPGLANSGFFAAEPFTRYKIYLPFVGLVDLPSEALMGISGNRGGGVSLTIRYYNDCVTGATIASVSVPARINPGGSEDYGNFVSLCQYGCNTSVNYALTGANYTGFVSSLASVATGIVTAGASAATGNPGGVILGGTQALGGAIGGIQASNNTMTTGGFSANTGALATKRPYVVSYTSNIGHGNDSKTGWTKDTDYIANNILHMRAQTYQTLADIWNGNLDGDDDGWEDRLRGYIRTLDAQVAFDGCTEEESKEICQIMNNEGFYLE